MIKSFCVRPFLADPDDSIYSLLLAPAQPLGVKDDGNHSVYSGGSSCCSNPIGWDLPKMLLWYDMIHSCSASIHTIHHVASAGSLDAIMEGLGLTKCSGVHPRLKIAGRTCPGGHS